jgi:hypothetical protein
LRQWAILPARFFLQKKREQEKVLEGHVRNWKTALARTAPKKIYGRVSGREFSANGTGKGAGRACAELE